VYYFLRGAAHPSFCTSRYGAEMGWGHGDVTEAEQFQHPLSEHDTHAHERRRIMRA
jgi:hypothetical protein